MTDYISREAAINEIKEDAGCDFCGVKMLGCCLSCSAGRKIRRIEQMPAADVRHVERGVPLIEINEPWQQMRGDKNRFYYTKRYLCRNCEYQIKTESWEKDRCFGAGTIFKDNSMPNFCPNCGAAIQPGEEASDES